MSSDMKFVACELTALLSMNVQALRDKYREVFGEATTSHSAAYLRRKIAWMIQWQAEDRIPERTLARIVEGCGAAPARTVAPPGRRRLPQRGRRCAQWPGRCRGCMNASTWTVGAAVSPRTMKTTRCGKRPIACAHLTSAFSPKTGKRSRNDD
jgi:hypothetical protein